MACCKKSNTCSAPSKVFNKHELKLKANSMRKNIIRMISSGKSGHPGGSLSACDIVATLFFSDVMDYNKKDANDHSQDRFFLSKGHAAPVLYAAYRELEWIDEADLSTLRQLGTKLQGHPDCHACPGVEICSGSLGQGLSVACGCALGLKLDAKKAGNTAPTVFTILGDGEMQEGSVWEAMMFAAHQNLDNLVAILDKNRLQIDGEVEEVCSLGDIDAKAEAFGWKVLHVCGHCVVEVHKALQEAKAFTGAPVLIVCDTVKGKGVSFMENNAGWHGKAPSAEQTADALAELEKQEKKLNEEVCGE